MKKIIVIDNYDSFTYNLVHYIKNVTGVLPDVFRNDKITGNEVLAYDKVLLSPGPGVPDEAGNLKEIIKTCAPSCSIFGVCLGLQAVAEVFGGTLFNLDRVFHGVASPITQTQEYEPLFDEVPRVFDAGRYHSWMVSREKLPEELIVTSVDNSDQIMSLRHAKYDVRGVQFHPESILTEYGGLMIKNWINL
ncbi:MAG: aminodeoxychorismate/anthranilate synthase component II [Bacteroidetes bacterium HGW-Bacteroidetes-4]|jgi:anthranilate synthase component 2|nr:MAG: aminodeoxychorismate/anthranilate synthase component II [Bacteroidetes bacterium HGW-Bacteroidetes-4]